MEVTEIKNRVLQYQEETIRLRRHFHRHPELSLHEFNTAKFIAQTLQSWGVPFREGIANTGLVATIEGMAGPGKTIALRADMDALPIHETSEKEYSSITPGVMHACGHDVHMAALLGSIRVLNDLKPELQGSVRCLFQPSEETFPGGALPMIQEGALDNPRPAAIFAQHTLPELEAGKVGMRPGRYMASTDEIYIVVKGKGGHAATPELNIDPVVISAHIVTALQQITSRYAKNATPTLLSFGRFIADGRTNIIPDEVHLAGTFRTFDEVWREQAHQRIKTIATTLAEGMGARCRVDIHKGYPSLHNDEELTQRAWDQARFFLGEQNVVELDMRMTAEDFAYFGQIIPGCMFRLGTMDPATRVITNLHTSHFDVDEKSLMTGVGLMTWLTLMELKD